MLSDRLGAFFKIDSDVGMILFVGNTGRWSAAVAPEMSLQ